jgi:nicotinamidase/pyrazinamidase
VKFTAVDAVELGYKTHLIVDGTRAVNIQPEDGDNAVDYLRSIGVTIMESTAL